ncbi:MAG: hypothetical protein L0332_11335 [Chloroflexi bacterium]|nr:hypothetical protein [Chloroflexota bacterium]MCI0581109.1 hypothetical protein [Chloroflexota bacterium]MCI0647829.1 hypothetical protein [Chloroflexota bacterium]MCI0727301.1 hypothetical protein [Chloroflexota bacterium]
MKPRQQNLQSPISNLLLPTLLLGTTLLCHLVAPAARPPNLSPLQQRDLSSLACQVEDMSGPTWSLIRAEAAAPSLAAYGEPVANAYSVLLGDHSLAYFAIQCEIAVYQDEAAARRVLEKACLSGQPAGPPPAVGQAACALHGDSGEAPRQLFFRRGPAVIFLHGDTSLNGPAASVDRRLVGFNP